MESIEQSLLFLEEPYQWDKLAATFDWLKALKDCPQDAIYHAEGDVFIHTRMVVDALLSLPAWQQLDQSTRSILFAACLLHDIGKPKTTVIEENGRITSRGHAKKGEFMVRQILADVHRPFTFREQICKLVRHHGLPLWFFEKADPQKTVIGASLVVNTEWLAWVAEADIRGRICADQNELLYKVDLFREFCKENNCYGKPYTFPSDHSRFLYFHKEDATYPAYEAFDDTQFDVYLMLGLPGSGKDTWILNNHPDLPVVSLDAIREHMGIAPTDNQGPVMQAAKEYARVFMRKKQSFIWNATNVVRRTRSELIDLFTTYGGRTTIVYMDKPINTVISQNWERSRVVPEHIIYRFFEKLEPPDVSEARQVIVVSS
jgi:putative nucleotidyltransferase with HDIG domain